MKKNLFSLAAFALVLTTILSCTSSDDGDSLPDGVTLKTLTFEDSSYKAGDNYIGEQSWSSLIDNAESGGALLYGEGGYGVTTPYQWSDNNNTELCSEIADTYESGTYEFWNGGVAISNYHTDVAEGCNSMNQLSIPVKSGYNNSKNFAIVYGYTTINFSDNTDRVIDHLYITNTSYAYSVCKYGDGSSTTGLDTDDSFWVTITGYSSMGNSTGEVKFDLAKEGKIVDVWKKCDLTTLGEVAYITFSFDSTIHNDYGSVIPSYMAIDNIAVQFKK